MHNVFEAQVKCRRYCNSQSFKEVPMRYIALIVFISLLVPMLLSSRLVNSYSQAKSFIEGGEVPFARMIQKQPVSLTQKMLNSSNSSFLKIQSSVSFLNKSTADVSQISSFPSQDSRTSYISSFPLTMGNGALFVVWASPYGDSLYSVKSTDNGLTWSSPSFINLTGNYCSDLCGIRTTNGRMIIIWQNNINGLTTCYSDDNGATWSSLASITTNATDYYTALTQTLDGKLWISFSRYNASTNYDIFYCTSTNNGDSWSAEQTFLATSTNELYGTVVSKDNLTLKAFYRENSSGNSDIYSKTSTDDGATWSSPTPIVNSSAVETRPRVLRQSDGTLWLIYQYYETSTGGCTQSEIYYTKSSDGGTSWNPASSFTNYAGYDGWFNACLKTNQPFVTFASNRWNAIQNQTHLWYGIIGTSLDSNPPPALTLTKWPSPERDIPVSIQAFVDDETGISNVTLSYHLNGSSYGPVQMYDDGLHNDSLPGDNIWGKTIGPFQLGDVCDFSIGITDVSSNYLNIFVSSFEIPSIHNAGNVILKFSSTSELADNAISKDLSAYWPKTNGYSYLCDGGLWIGCNVSGENRVMQREYNRNDWYRTIGTPYTLAPGVSDQDGDVTYDDQHAISTPIGLQVHQQSYQWSASSRDDFIIFKYTIMNQGTNGTLNDIFVSSWLDADVSLQTEASKNKVGYDSQRHLLYMYNELNLPSGYFGVRLLGIGNTPHTVNCYMIGADPLDDSERYQMMTTGNIIVPTSVDDYRFLLTASPFSLAPQNSYSVAYGIVLGDGLSELQTNADTMEAIYNSKIVTSVDEEQAENRLIPKSFALQQNFPNPFNPSTKITYAIPNISFVRLAVYDILGKEVATLVKNNCAPGIYSVIFDASKLPSGAYFYRLQAGSFSETKKLLLIK